MNFKPIERLSYHIVSRILNRTVKDAQKAKQKQLREYATSLEPGPDKEVFQKHFPEYLTDDGRENQS
jgi:hypothetical protein